MAKARRGVSDNIYTVLMFTALLVLAAGVVYVAIRSNELFGTINPLDKGADLTVTLLPMLGG